jgi:hypothetical protein
VVEMVASAGFADAATTEPGMRQYASQPFLLRRNEVSGYDTLSSFAQKAGLPPPPSGWTAPAASPAGSPSPSPSGSPGVCPQAATPEPAAAGHEIPTPSPSSSPDPTPCATPQARRRHGG